MAEHVLKTWPNAFEAVKSGVRRFEWRKDDRGFEVGDTLVLKAWDPQLRDPYQTPHVQLVGPRGWWAEAEPMRVRVTYILRGMFGVPGDYCVMSIEPEEVLNANVVALEPDELEQSRGRRG